MDFVVHIDDSIWSRVRSGDAFGPKDDPDALVAILMAALEATGKVKTSTDLMLITGKIKVEVAQPRQD
jgi:hypothetical protein